MDQCPFCESNYLQVVEEISHFPTDDGSYMSALTRYTLCRDCEAELVSGDQLKTNAASYGAAKLAYKGE